MGRATASNRMVGLTDEEAVDVARGAADGSHGYSDYNRQTLGEKAFTPLSDGHGLDQQMEFDDLLATVSRDGQGLIGVLARRVEGSELP
jgi:hypothetical protein